MTVKEAQYILSESSENEYSDVDENEADSSNKESDDEHLEAEDGSAINTGWVDSIAKILTSKKPKRKRTLVLSRAKKISDVKKEKPKDIGFEIEGEVKEEKPDLDLLGETEAPIPAKKQRREKCSIRAKPNILDKDRERTLAKIATRGVVQLFNSVRMQQKDVSRKLDEAGSLIRKREKVLKNIDKRAFLNVLMGEKSESVDNAVKGEEKQEDPERASKSTWKVLRDDFMMDAKFKDWDKETDEKDEKESEEFSESD